MYFLKFIYRKLLSFMIKELSSSPTSKWKPVKSCGEINKIKHINIEFKVLHILSPPPTCTHTHTHTDRSLNAKEWSNIHYMLKIVAC